MTVDYMRKKIRISERYAWDKLSAEETTTLKKYEWLRKLIRENPIWQESRCFDDYYMNKLVLDIVKKISKCPK
jgi:hypothetical protein